LHRAEGAEREREDVRDVREALRAEGGSARGDVGAES
jgi:hypothetical protein